MSCSKQDYARGGKQERSVAFEPHLGSSDVRLCSLVVPSASENKEAL